MTTGVRVQRRGRILAPVRVEAPARPMQRHRPAVFLLLLLVLPMFGQCFHYMIDVPPLYYLSKAWPVLTVPLGLYALTQLSLPFKPLCMVMLAFLVGVTPAVSMVQLGNGLSDAMATTVKIWPFFYYFSVAALLAMLRPTPAQVRAALVVLGIGTFVVMLALWLVVPLSAYPSDPAKSKLLMYEYERGYRIVMPMFFGILFLFYLVRRFCARQEWWTLPLFLAGLVLMLWIYKQRTALGGVVLVAGFAVLTSARGWWRILAYSTAAAAVVAFAAVYSVLLADRVDQMLGASLSIRQTSMALALEYLQVSPMRWFLGVGAVTRFSEVTLAEILGNTQFYLADIGWIGVLFEYGVIGVFLLTAFYIAAFRVAHVSAAGDGQPMTKALADYVLYALVTSSIYSVVFTPGEIATVMAIAVYCRGTLSKRDSGPDRFGALS